LVLSAANSENTCSEVRDLTAGHLADVRAKIADLQATGRVLSEVRFAGWPAGAGSP
jgi:MerR, DNA binding